MPFKRIPKPNAETLKGKSLSQIAAEFDVSERTARRWLASYDLYEPRPNYGCDKLSAEIAQTIRKDFRSGKTIKELSSHYKVTPATISRILHQITYPVKPTETAKVTVIYNPH